MHRLASTPLLVVLIAAMALPPGPNNAPARHATTPCVSPDGRWIAFLSERDSSAAQVYVLRADGRGERQLTHAPETKLLAGWTRDGRRVLVERFASDTLHLVALSADGRGETTLFTAVSHEAQLSHDARHVAYTTGSWAHTRIMVAGADGRDAHVIADSTAGYFNLAWSHDDKRLAVTRLDTTRTLQVWVMDAAGRNAHALTSVPDLEGLQQWPAWSPDDRRIAVQDEFGDEFAASHRSAIVEVFDCRSGVMLASESRSGPRLDETPAWFPDGKRLAFQSDRTGRFEIWVVNADGTGAKQLTR